MSPNQLLSLIESALADVDFLLEQMTVSGNLFETNQLSNTIKKKFLTTNITRNSFLSAGRIAIDLHYFNSEL